MAEVLDLTEDLPRSALERAKSLLEAGELVAFPTETVYGLGADAKNPRAVAKIFEAKGRPQNNPLIVHVAAAEGARLISRFDDRAEALTARFWPGPLTLVLEKRDTIPDIVTAGGSTVAVRAPDHRVAQALLQVFDGPIAAPSANRTTSISPTRAQHVEEELGEFIPLILDGGPATVGLESTVLDLSGSEPMILRPGAIVRSSLERVLGTEVQEKAGTSSTPKSPGLVGRHYSPKTRVELCSKGAVIPSGAVVLVREGESVDVGPNVTVRTLPEDAEGYGRELYDALRWADHQSATAIFITEPPSTEIWTAIRDRLRRAAHAL